MSTRCLIGKKESDGRIKAIYCHHDGYHSYVGAILKKHYTNEESINQLLSLGGLSCLGVTPVSAGTEAWDDYSKYEKTDEGFHLKCLDYFARGEDLEILEYADETEYLQDSSFCESLYLFDKGKWKDLLSKKKNF